MAYLSMTNPDVYRTAIRSSCALWYTVDATYGGAAVPGATGLRPTGGTITDTTKPGVRRTLNLELAPAPGLFDLLSPIGTTLTVTAHVRLTDYTVIDIPMGVFDVDSESLSAGSGGLSLTAPDLWVRIQRARFVGPAPSYPDVTVVEQLRRMIVDVMPSVTVNITATSQAMMPPQVWEKDRDKAIIELAKSIGAWVYFDRTGVATIADAPTFGASADWLIDASASGVLTELDRQRSRTGTYNVVFISSSATDGERFPFQCVWDNDPTSPTFAGTDPRTPPDDSGPFGIVPLYFDTPIASTAAEAIAAGQTILAQAVGLASQVSLGSVPNPAIDAWDTIDVLPPRERYDVPRILERHVVDTVTHPLGLGQATHIDGRSTRAEEITGTS